MASTPTSARPPRPRRHTSPVSAPDGGTDSDRPLENYFDASMASRLVPSHPTTRLYDTVARAHDHRFQITPDMVDPSAPCPQILRPRERRRSLAYLRGNSIEYMGISSDSSGWRPRRSIYEDRRGSIGVAPSEVNTLIPYIPPIDTSVPPPSREWLDEMAKRFLAGAQADLQQSCPNTTSDVSKPQPNPLTAEDSFSFSYDSDSSLDRVITVPRASIPQSSQPQPQSDSNPTSDECSDTDTDTDSSTDGEYDLNSRMMKFQYSEQQLKWLIPRRRRSVVLVDDKYVPASVTPPSNSTTPPPSNDEQARKRQRGRRSAPCGRATKTPKTCANDTPARPNGRCTGTSPVSVSEEDSSRERPAHSSCKRDATIPPLSPVTATARQTNHVRFASPCTASPQVLPQPDDTSNASKQPRLYPCRLSGCTQICTSAGDLQRHQQSLRHRAPSYGCLSCGKSYTRLDALRRHLNNKAACKKEHSTMFTDMPDPEPVGPEANTQAVQNLQVPVTFPDDRGCAVLACPSPL